MTLDATLKELDASELRDVRRTAKQLGLKVLRSHDRFPGDDDVEDFPVLRYDIKEDGRNLHCGMELGDVQEFLVVASVWKATVADLKFLGMFAESRREEFLNLSPNEILRSFDRIAGSIRRIALTIDQQFAAVARWRPIARMEWDTRSPRATLTLVRNDGDAPGGPPEDPPRAA